MPATDQLPTLTTARAFAGLEVIDGLAPDCAVVRYGPFRPYQAEKLRKCAEQLAERSNFLVALDATGLVNIYRRPRLRRARPSLS